LVQAVSRLFSARLLALVGALLFTYGAWAPWVLIDASAGYTIQAHTYRFLVTPEVLGPPPISAIFNAHTTFVVWSALSVTGVLQAPLLWITNVQLFRWCVRLAFGGWTLLMTWLLLASTHVFFIVPQQVGMRPANSFIVLTDETGPPVTLHIVASAPREGLWLVMVALGLCLGAPSSCSSLRDEERLQLQSLACQ
jgi:hypothetical protein